MSKKKKIILAATAGVVIFIILPVGLVFGFLRFFNNHPARQTAIEYIENHPEILAVVGEITSYGRFSSGSIHASGGGRGEAEFTIRVNGTNASVSVHVLLIREPLRDWEVINFHYRLR